MQRRCCAILGGRGIIYRLRKERKDAGAMGNVRWKQCCCESRSVRNTQRMSHPFEDGRGFTVDFPDLPGCVTEGRTLSETLEMAVDAAAGWILSSLEDGEAIPKATDYKDVHLKSKDGIINMVV